MVGMRSFTAMNATLACCLIPAASLWAANVDAEWGFDGTVVTGAPNLLTITVDNPGDDAIDGTIVLHEGASLLAQSGTPYVAHVFIAPRSVRSVQFAPWIEQDSKWTVTGTALGDREVVLDEPRMSRPGRVVIAAPDALGAPRSGLAVFAEERFPDTVALCDGLGEAVLDHVPRRWSPPQRQALRDWVAGGGTLDVLKGIDGQYPEFSGELAPFLVADGAFGQGRIVHLDATLETPPPDWQHHVDDDRDHDGRRNAYALERGILASATTRHFQARVRPHLPWGMINLLLIAFLVLVGFGPMIASRRGVDWRWVNAGVVAAIVLSCLAVVALGRRGYGETSQLRALALAHWIDGTVYDVTMHADLFVVASGQYTIAHSGKPNLYGTGDDSEAGSVIATDDGASFRPVVPLFSNCPFRVRLRADLGCAAPVSDGNHGMAMDLPPGASIAAACLAHAGKITTLNVTQGTGHALMLAGGGATDFDSYGDRYGGMYNSEDVDRDRMFQELFTAAVREECLRTGADADPDAAKKNANGKGSAPAAAPADADAERAAARTWAYVLVMELPQTLRATTAAPLAQDGAVVYCFPWSDAP